jgi:citronellol/citronellal dehydrogenase
VVDRQLEGKVAIVTGASRGIGEAIAKRLGEAGAMVVISARTFEPNHLNPGSLIETAEGMRSSGVVVLPVRCDLSNPSDRVHLVDETMATFGSVDILVNNAAVTFLRPHNDFSEKHFKLMLEVQLWAPFELIQRVVPHMRERGAGWIVNISSKVAMHPTGPPFDSVHKHGHFSAYGTVKAGLNRMTTALAAELYDDGIAVNALAPWDNVATPGAGHHSLVDGFPLEDPEVMAEATLVLCSAPPQQLTGRVTYSQPLLEETQRHSPQP